MDCSIYIYNMYVYMLECKDTVHSMYIIERIERKIGLLLVIKRKEHKIRGIKIIIGHLVMGCSM